MKEYRLTIRMSVENETLEEYADIDDMVYSTMEEVPFSFEVEDAVDITID